MAIKGFESDDFSAPMVEINMTPLVDVMLVLFVIFLITAPVMTQSILLELPDEVAIETNIEESIMIFISKHGEYHWNDTLVTESRLNHHMKSIATKSKTYPIHLYADIAVPYGKIARFLALSQKYNLKNINFITQSK